MPWTVYGVPGPHGREHGSRYQSPNQFWELPSGRLRAVDEFHHDPRAAVLGHHPVVHGHDARMLQPGGGTRLTPHPGVPAGTLLLADPLGQPQFLDGDLAVQAGVERSPDHPHPALPDLLHELVPARQQPPAQFAHRPNITWPLSPDEDISAINTRRCL